MSYSHVTVCGHLMILMPNVSDKKDWCIWGENSRSSKIRDGSQNRTKSCRGPAAADGDAVTEVAGYGREEHAQPLPQEHGRTHRRNQEPVAVS